MNSTIFANPVQTYQFLSVFNYINTLSDVFYSQNIITEERYQPVPILNTFFEYVHQSNNETETRLNLIQKCLHGSDLYGGKENETLDIEYVNATFDYIISNIVFIQFGGVYGYLALLVNSCKNLTTSSIKQEILVNLENLKFINVNGSISHLSSLAADNIFETLVRPQLPPTEEDMKLIDVNYLYAVAGIKLARSAKLDLSNITFNDYIVMSQIIESSYLKNEIHESALQIFTLPALLLYAHESNLSLSKNKIASLLQDDEFWSEAFHFFFSYLRDSFRAMEEKINANNTLYQFVSAMSKFKSRTVIAEENLRKFCSLDNKKVLEDEIPYYKFYASNSKCPGNEKLLPNVDEDYSKEVDRVKEKYRLHMKFLIRESFPEDLIRLINSSETTVYESQAVSQPFCQICLPGVLRVNSSTVLFAIRKSAIYFYALVESNNSITILRLDNGHDEFLKALNLPLGELFNPRASFEIPSSGKIFKHSSNNFATFVDRTADYMAERFRNELHTFGYEKTLGQKIVEIILHFVPFYDCVTDASAGNTKASIFSCSLDVVSLIPIIGPLSKVGVNIGEVVIGISVKTFAMRQVLNLRLIGQTAAIALQKTFTSEILKSFSLGLIRTLDPGFEFVGMITTSGGKLLGKVFKKSLTSVSKQFPSIGVDLAKFKNIWRGFGKKKGKEVPRTIVVGHMEGHEIFVKTYPGGVHPYGPKYVHLPSGQAELRRMIGFDTERPFVVSRVSKFGTVFYRKIDIQTGEPSKIEFKMNKKGLLRQVRQPFRQHIKTIVTEGLSGRGKLMEQRAQRIEEAAIIVSESKLQISKIEAIRTMQNYFLSVLPPEVPHNLALPSYNKLAQDWIAERRIEKLYKNFFIKDENELKKLLVDVKVDQINNVARAKKKIDALYGPYHKFQVGNDLSQLMENYGTNRLRTYVKFEDAYAIKNWISKEYGKMFMNDVELLRTKNALYRFAVRIADREETKVPKILYFGKRADPALFQSKFVNREGKIINPKIVFVSQVNAAEEVKFRNLPGNFANAEKISFLLEIHMDSIYRTAILKRLFPNESNRFVIFPMTMFRIGKIKSRNIDGKDVKIVELFSMPIEKDLWIYNLLQEIEKVKAPGIPFYSN